MRINSLVDTAELKKDVAILSSAESHHLARVLRVQVGQEITLFDGQGEVAEAVIEEVSKTAMPARVFRKWSEPKSEVEIALIQAVPKPDRWEMVLQKAVELGVSSIQPILTQHTEFRSNAKKQDRWGKIVLNAAQQCEVRWIPELRPLEKLETVLSSLEAYDLVLVGSLYDGAKMLKDVKIKGQKRVALLVGPEGDFSEEEVLAMVQAGSVPVSFGNRILRTETAAIFGLSVLAYELF